MPFSVLNRPLLRALLLGIGVAALVAGGSLYASLRYLSAPIPALDAPVVFTVSAGSSFSRISRELSAAGYVEHPLLFRLLARWRGVESGIKTGEYQLQVGLTPSQLLDTLVKGDTLQYRVTLVEGWTVAQALNAIWASERLERRLDAYVPEQVAELLGLEQDNPEGMLFPDTYFYTAGTTDVQILLRAHARLQAVLANAWEQRLGALPFETPYEAPILASIIEKESAFGAERGHIAGVFVRRLETGMRLQSDPTVIYGLQESFDGNLTRRDLALETAYNTYRVAGLPPTPIALAGLDSIVASLHPLQSDYLYFVSKGNGEHHFSSTLEEHNDAVRRYQIEAATQ
jgi:UPF0755 protein